MTNGYKSAVNNSYVANDDKMVLMQSVGQVSEIP